METELAQTPNGETSMLAQVSIEDLEALANMPERIATGDVPFHAHLVKEMETLAKLQQQAQLITAQIGQITGSRDVWMRYAEEKYHLKEGDSIQPDGTISRKTSKLPAESE
jgi:conjugal transfer/entry exclusion protein